MTADDRETDRDGEPKFADLYQPGPDNRFAMTPRMAYWLWSTSIFLSDTWRDARDDPALLLDFLPPIARPSAHGDWFDSFVDCFEQLAARLGTGEGVQGSLALCTGEELALHLVIDLAETYLADGIIGPDIDEAAALPDHASADDDFDAMRERLFTDHDVLMLFDMSFDGVDDPDSEIAQIQRHANLNPRDWFKPFAAS